MPSSTCAKCGTAFEWSSLKIVGRRDCCVKCGADLHVCLVCKHYDRNARWECRETSVSEAVRDKEKANFCDFYSPREGGTGGATVKQDLLSAAEALFKKK